MTIISRWLKAKYRQKQSSSYPNRSEQGLSMMEVLVSILVSTIILAAISPVILMTVATRLLQVRAEQALNLAQSEIDRIQVNTIRGAEPTELDKIPPEMNTPLLSIVEPPTGIVTDYEDLEAENALRVDLDEDGKLDYFVQMFRDEGQTFNSGDNEGELAIFNVTVRVYGAAAENNLGKLETERAQITLTQGLAQQRTRPLAVLSAQISRSDTNRSLDEYQEYLEN